MNEKSQQFSDKELWNLDKTLAEYIYPRLKRFKEIVSGRPGCFETQEKWLNTLEQMIVAFELLSREDPVLFLKEDERKDVDKGLKKFYKYYNCLWF